MTGKPGSRPVNGLAIQPVQIVQASCEGPGKADFLKNIRSSFRKEGLANAVKARDSSFLFDWLMHCFSYQGVSDAIAAAYILEHGNATYLDLERSFQGDEPICSKLADFEAFRGCGYNKTSRSCNNAEKYSMCALPNLNLRKGQLNQAAYSLYLFVRDVCGGDLVGFIDVCLAEADLPGHPDRLAIMRNALTDRLLLIFGVAEKILSMSFADLLIGADPRRKKWVEVGASMIAIDSLVHNFLRRAGLHYKYGTDHSFGSACYGPDGCANIIDQIARQIDCSKFDRTYPIYFPRFIQHSIWRFCSEAHGGLCNGRAIDDQDRCVQKDCTNFDTCGRVILKPA